MEYAQDALASMPDGLRERMSNVEIVVEEEPPAGQPLLGLYQGVPLTRRTSYYEGVLPDKITLYRGPILRLYGHLTPSACAARSGASSSTRSRTTSVSATSVWSRSTATDA